MKKVFLFCIVAITFFVMSVSENKAGTANPIIYKKHITIKIDLPFIDLSVKETWIGKKGGRTGQQKFCPQWKPYDCEYTIEYGCLIKNIENSENPNLEFDAEVAEGADLVVLKPVDCSDIPEAGDTFLMSEHDVPTEHGFTMHFPEQEMKYIPELNGFFGYYFKQ